MGFCQAKLKSMRIRFIKQKDQSKEKQIQFFKKIKPIISSEVFFQNHLFEFYKSNPKGSLKSKKVFLYELLDNHSRFLTKHKDFHTYMQLGLTHLDESYFTLTPFCPTIHGQLEIPLDPKFNSPADLTNAKLIASEKMINFLYCQLATLDNPNLDPTWESANYLPWAKTKTDLIELIYCLHSSGAIPCELKDIVKVFEKLFHLDLGNFYRTFTDIKLKQNPVSFINELENSLIEKIRREIQ